VIKSYIRSGLRYNEERSRLEHMAPVISFSLDDGRYYEDEYSYLSRVNERRYFIEKWHGYPGRILCHDNQTSEVFEYNFKKNEVGNEVVFPECNKVYKDWCTILIEHGRQGYPPRKVTDTKIWNRMTGEEIILEGRFDLLFGVDNCLVGKFKKRDNSKCLIKFDLTKGGIDWENLSLQYAQKMDVERFMVHDSGCLKIFSLETAELLKTISFPSRVSGPFRYGSVRRYLSPEGQVFNYDSSTDDVSEYQLFGKGAEDGSDFTHTEDHVCATNSREHRLRVYSIAEKKCIAEGYLPEIGVGLGTSPVSKIGDYYSFTVNDRSRWKHGYYTRTYLFTLDDLKADSPEYDHEELKADYERVTRENAKVDYRVFFADVESYSVLYRHTNAIVMSIGQEYGWTKAFEGNSRDEQFTGKIIVDVSNQSLDDEQKNYLELLCTYLANELQLFYRAGMDPEQFITVTPQFD